MPVTVSTYDRKIRAYADDANLLVKLEYETLLRIKNILDEFGQMSGLECNVDKTTLLPLRNAVMDIRISELGFQIADCVTILGLDINKTGIAASNFERITTKVRSIIAKWAPFKLSLPGRINIAKSMLYSQINY